MFVGLQRPLPVSGEKPNDGYTRVAGVVHVHTTKSDGGGTPEEVVAAAKRAGLGFVAITDHNNLDAKPLEGYRDGVLTLVGTEISTTVGHIVALDLPDPVFRFSGDGQDALDDVRDFGAVAFAAHPMSPRADFRFSGWKLPGPWGLELLNGDSQWREAGWGRLALTALLYGLNSRYALVRSLSSPDAMLREWDRMLQERDVPGIVGADAHDRLPISKRFAPRFPSYESVFGLAQNHVVLDQPLTQDASVDARAVVKALAHGRSYLGIDALASAADFSFSAEAGGRRFTMGERAPASGSLRFRAEGRVPTGTRIVLLKNGRALTESRDRLEAPANGPGVYRVEAFVPSSSLPWILTNPIYVFDQAEAAARAGRAAWPTPPEAPTASELLDDFEAKTGFAPGHDPASKLALPILDPRGGHDGHGAVRLEFELAEASDANKSPFVAIVRWGKADLTGRNGLVFWLRSDGVYRISVQVRDENPASADEGTEWWFASAKSTPEWRRIALPFARLRSINPKSDGRLDLDKVRAIVFVMDRGAIKLGSHGTLWIDDVGFY